MNWTTNHQLRDFRLEMRVGLPSEASSCLWSARGPRDRPERRRNGLAHVETAHTAIEKLSQIMLWGV